MGILGKLLAPVFDAWRKVMTPPAIPSTDELMEVTEADIEMDDVPESVRRARQYLGKGLYCLGAGCKDAKADDPWTGCAKPKLHSHANKGRVFSDCSGFVDFLHGWDRNDPVYGWRYCDSLFRDGKKQVPGDLGDEVPITEAREGDLVINRSVDTDGDGDRDIIGHIGIVSRRGKTWREIRVIHCASLGPFAVRESDGKIWERRGIVFRLR